MQMKTTAEMFEGQFVGYVLNTARMPFFITGHYPHYKLEGNKLVSDTGPESQALKRQALEAYDLIKRIQSRVERDLRIPRTWVRQLDEQTILVKALRERRIINAEWEAEFHRAIRYLKARVG